MFVRISFYKLPLRGLLLTFLLQSLALSASAQNGSTWPLAPSLGSGDERIVWGELENGFRYALLPIPEVEEKGVSVRFTVQVGSTDESKGFEGASRLVGQLAFEGGGSLDSESLFDLYERNGVSFYAGKRFGSGLSRSNYTFDFETLKEDDMGEFVRHLSEIAAGGPVSQETLERSRRTLLRDLKSELTTSSEVELFRDKLIFENSPYQLPSRDSVIASIESITASQISSFWSNSYTPGRMTLFAVGNIDVAEWEAKIREEFSGLSKNVAATKPVELQGKVRGNGDVSVVPWTPFLARVTLVNVSEPLDLWVAENEKRFWEYDFVGRYIQGIVNGDGQFNQGVTSVNWNRITLAPTDQGSVMALEEMLKKVDMAGQRLAERGIGSTEFARLKTEYLAMLNGTNELLSERESPVMLADRFMVCLVENRPFRAGMEHGDYLRAIVESLDLDRVDKICSEVFSLKQINLIASIPRDLGLSSKALGKRVKLVRRSYNFNWAVPTGNDSDWNVKEFFGDAGMATSTKTVEFEKYYALQYVFENSTRLNLVRMDDMGGVFTVRLSVGNGVSDLETPFSGAEQIMNELLRGSSMGDHQLAPRLAQIMRGKGLSQVTAGANLDQLYWEAEGDTEEALFAFLSLSTEWLITAFIKEDDFDAAKERLLSMAKSDATNSDAILREELLYGGEKRMQRGFEASEVEEIEYADFKNWLTASSETGYLEVTVVGDVEPRKVLRDVRKTLASRPKREGKVVQPRHGTPAVYPEPGIRSAKTVSDSSRGLLSMYWPIPYEKSCSDTFSLAVLRKAFEHHVYQKARDFEIELRQLNVSSNSRQMIPGSDHIRLDIDCDIADVEAVRVEVLGWMESFAASLTEERIETCENAVQMQFRTMQRSRGGLLRFLDQSQGKPAPLKCAVSIASGAEDYPYSYYADLVNTVFSESNLRAAVIGANN